MKNNIIAKYFIHTIFLLLCISCISKNNKELSFALKFAGENQQELENVLKYYENDSEKLAAARFLIENMPYHYYLGYDSNEGFTEDLHVLDSLKRSKRKEEIKKLRETDQLFPSIQYFNKNDAQTITAKYLIKNIDQAFFVWKKQPWGKNISFESFCQNILPYRVGNEKPDEWREIYYNYFQPLLDSLMTNNDPITACRIIYDSITTQPWTFTPNLNSPHLGGEINAIDLYTIKNDVDMKFYEVKPETQKKFRYVRYITPGEKFSLITEVEFYDESGQLLKGKVIGTEGVVGKDIKLTKEAAFDGDPLTYFNNQDPNKAWTGLDLEKRQTIGKIRFV